MLPVKRGPHEDLINNRSGSDGCRMYESREYSAAQQQPPHYPAQFDWYVGKLNGCRKFSS